MRIGYVFIPFFPIAVERRRNPGLIGQPVIVGGYPYERKPVFAASSECVEAGVKAGMTLRQAHLLCPEAIFLELDAESYGSAYDEFLVALDYFSPAVERDDLGGAYLDAVGLTLLFGEERELGRKIVKAIRGQLGMDARAAFGPGKLVAKIAARLTPDSGVKVVKKGESAGLLFGLPVGRLGLGETSGERLRMLGLRTIGQFMQLPAQSLMEQLGPDAVAARRAIDEEEKDVVVPRDTPAFLERAVALDYPIGTMREFSLLARDLIASLVADLHRRYLACQMVDLHVELENGRTREASLQLKEPTDSQEDLLFTLEKLVSRASSSCISPPPALHMHDGELTALCSKLQSDARIVGATGGRPGRWGCANLSAKRRERDDAGIVALRVILSGLARPVSRQMGFFDAQRRRRAYLDKALDEIRERFGERIRQGVTLPQTTTHTTRAPAARRGG